MTNDMNRRIFLRGLGGAVVAAPFLSSVAERAAKAQGMTASIPKRLVVMFTHYGCVTNKYFPAKSHGALTADDLKGGTLEPLAPYVSKLLMPRGIRSMNEWTANLKRGQGNDSHTQIVGSFFTCQPVTPNSDDPFSFDQSTKFNAKPIGASLDHVIAQQVSSTGTPYFCNVGGAKDGAQSAISYSAATTLYPGFTSASQLYSNLTGLFKTGTTNMNPDTYAMVKGKSILDCVKDDLAALKRVDMSKADKDKLAAWEALLTTTSGPITSAVCSADLGTKLGATQANATSATGLTKKVTDSMDAWDVWSAIAALSVACNANPVVFIKAPPNYLFKDLGITTEAHSLSHRLDNAGMQGNCLPNALKMLLQVDGYYAQKFAKLVGYLDSIPEGDKTVLDNSVAIWFQEMSDGNSHNLNNAPILQAGSGGGYFKTGQAINVEDGSANLSQGNSMSSCADGSSSQTINGTTQSTGTPSDKANAPINKYFCNIMNYMGVKAGDDGFPKKGGSAPVTKFGFSDKTEEFIHGEKSTAHSIHDPGEFTQLKA